MFAGQRDTSPGAANPSGGRPSLTISRLTSPHACSPRGFVRQQEQTVLIGLTVELATHPVLPARWYLPALDHRQRRHAQDRRDALRYLGPGLELTRQEPHRPDRRRRA
jgi:hypothetical protein